MTEYLELEILSKYKKSLLQHNSQHPLSLKYVISMQKCGKYSFQSPCFKSTLTVRLMLEEKLSFDPEKEKPVGTS
jgi:hypothetical protein